MSDLRFDPVTHQWVSIAESRRNRPVEYMWAEQSVQKMICPFCAGNEEETPEAIATYDEKLNQMSAVDEESPWSVRVIPNKYPAFEGEAVDSKMTGPYKTARIEGVQELIIPTSKHVASIADLELDDLKRAFRVARQRIEYLATVDEIKHAMFFMNCRLEAGASIEHIHFQLLGSPVLSHHLERRRKISKEYYDANHQSQISRIVDWELTQKTRVIRSTKDFVVFCPFASRLPLSVWIAPAESPERFEECEEHLDVLSELCFDTVRRIDKLLDRPAYNLLLHQAPFGGDNPDHWYIEIFPRLSRWAGFEWGTDIWINPVAPETAAKQLRVNE